MNLCFFGHSDFEKTPEIEKEVIDFLEMHISPCDATFLLGEHGNFDFFAYQCCCRYKKAHPTAQIEVIIPYRNLDVRIAELPMVDHIVYPNLDHIPKKFAILYRNSWMIKQSDLIVSYVNYHRGGAYQATQKALKMGKPVKNFGSLLL